jgi:hypothetical protein
MSVFAPTLPEHCSRLEGSASSLHQLIVRADGTAQIKDTGGQIPIAPGG